MEEKHEKLKKSAFIHGPIKSLEISTHAYFENVKKVLANESTSEIIGILPCEVSLDGNERPLLLSREIVTKIEQDHGNICGENIIINAHEWEYVVLHVDEKIDRINLIKLIPDSENYLLIAANRENGFYLVTHFETESTNGNKLKRLLKRGNVIRRVPSVASTTDQDYESQLEKESSVTGNI